MKKVAVIGAGVMGASIAAHIANSGSPVILLDIVSEKDPNRNAISEAAIDRLLKAEPPAFMDPRFAKLLQPGNLEDHLEWLKEADWVIEAIVENPDAKKELYRKLESVCRKDTLISSNTSTLPLALLTQGFSQDFCSRFMITHFFNPPRYMRLLECVTHSDTLPELVEALAHFADQNLGKTCIFCKDTPGFIGNRIGVYWLQTGLLEAIKSGLSVEEADAVFSTPLGIPKTGIFGLLDLVGLDLIPHILGSMAKALSPEDSFQQISHTPELVQKMIAEGLTGRKGKGGFYRKPGKIKESIDLASGLYKPSLPFKPARDLPGLLSGDDNLSVYFWTVLSNTLVYAASLVPEVTDDIDSIDEAMKLGYNWKYGPFEWMDLIGVDFIVEKLKEQKRSIPPMLKPDRSFYRAEAGKPFCLTLSGDYRPLKRREGVLLLSDIKLLPAVLENESASLWDIGDDVACLEFHSKMNTLDMDSMNLIRQSLEKVEREFRALVIYNEAENFSAGANLKLLMAAIQASAWDDVAQLIRTGQQTYKAIKYSPFPVVAAPSGLALGGGCEIILHCDAIQAHAELYAGLVEVGVGLIPGWGGCKEYLRRCLEQPKRLGGPIPPLTKTFETIGTASVSKSAMHAREMLFLANTDGITMNRSRLLQDAKDKALALCKDYAPPKPYEYRLPGKTAKAACNMGLQAMRLIGKATAYDVEVLQNLADVLSGGNCDINQTLQEDDLLQLELHAFVQLTQNPGTLARLDHMLKTGKPLRN